MPMFFQELFSFHSSILTIQGSDGEEKMGVSLALVSRWRTAIARQLVLDAEASRNPSTPRKPEPYSDYYTLAWAR